MNNKSLYVQVNRNPAFVLTIKCSKQKRDKFCLIWK